MSMDPVSSGAHSDQAIVLVVDDDHDMVAALCDILREAGYRPLSAHSGNEALAIVERESPDVLISDLRMAGMSGHGLQAELKRIAPDLPVIIITAFGSIQTAVESMKLGAFDYITKPFSNSELLLLVARALENRALRSEVKRLRIELARNHGLENIIAVESEDDCDAEQARAGRRQQRQRADHRRERHRQGPAGARASLPERAPQRPVRARQLRGDSREPHRERAVRTRARRLHRRQAEQGRPLRRRQPRHSLPRRNRRDAADGPGQAAPSHRGQKSPPARRDRRDHRRRPRHRRHQRRFGKSGRRRPLPLRSILSHRNRHDGGAAAARPSRRHSAADQALPDARRRRGRQTPAAISTPKRRIFSRTIDGPATSASCKTRFSRPSSSAPARRSPAPTCRAGSPATTTPRLTSKNSRHAGCPWKKSNANTPAPFWRRSTTTAAKPPQSWASTAKP